MEARRGTRLSRAGLLAITVLLVACAGSRRPQGAAGTVRGSPPGEVTPAFQGMASVLLEAQRRAGAGDLPALRALHPDLTQHGVGLLRSGLPHDLREADLPRYQEGRAAFGRALTAWARAVEAGDDGALPDALSHLTDAYWGWVDAYKGLPPERSV